MSNQWYDIDSWQWVDNEDAQWGFTTEPPIPGYEGLYQIWTDAQYVYAATTSGLDIIDIDTEQRISFATNPNGYTTVWASDDQVFLGTTSAGVKVLNKSSIGPAELASQIQDYERAPFLPDDNVRYIHGNENKLICCTAEGVAIIRRNSHWVTKTTISGARKCFVTPDHDYYYFTTSGTENWSLHRLNGNSGSWTSSDIIYTTGSGFLSEATCLVDFYVTEHTSISGFNNTIFVATDAGVYVYDEGSQDYALFTTVS